MCKCERIQTMVTLEIKNSSRPQVSRGKILPVAPLQRVCSLELEALVHQICFSSPFYSVTLCDFEPNLRFQLKGFQLALRTVTGDYISGAYVDADHCRCISLYLSYSKHAHGISLRFPASNYEEPPSRGRSRQGLC